MRKIYWIFLPLFLSSCVQYKNMYEYKLESVKGYDIPVCVEYSQGPRVNGAAWIDIGGKDRNKIEPITYHIVSYSYCLERLPKRVHLVEKKENDMTICYDRNNKVKLPILYCQKDVNIYQDVTVY